MKKKGIHKQYPILTSESMLIILTCMTAFASAIFAIYSIWPPQIFPIDDQLHLDVASRYSFWQIWASPHFGLYIPINYSILKILELILSFQYIWLFNFLLHWLNSFLVFFFLRNYLSRKLSLFCAFIFAIHPENVQVMMWFSELRASLSLTFLLLGLFFLDKSWFVRALIALLASLLSKPVAIALTPYFLFRIYQKKPRVAYVSAILMTIVCFGLYNLNRQGQPINRLQTNYEFWQIPKIFLFSVGHYILQTLAPFKMAFDYGYSTEWILKNPWGIKHLVGIVFFGVPLIVAKLRPVFVLYLLTLLPVSGVTHFNYQNYSQVVDRYNYSSKIFLILGLGLLFGKAKSKTLILGLTVWTIFLGITGVTFVREWRSPVNLLSKNVEIYPQSYMAHFYLARELVKARNLPESLIHFEKALEILPGSIDLLKTMGWIEVQLNQCERAVPRFRFLFDNQVYEDTTLPLANCLIKLGDHKNAREVLETHLKWKPDDPLAAELLTRLPR